MTTRVFTTALSGAVLLVAIGAGAWYFFAAPKEALAMPGSISGTVIYPSEYIPPQRVCAVAVDGPDASAICVNTSDIPESNSVFKIEKVPPGDYFVYAQLRDPASIGSDIPGSFKAYYNEFVRCGLLYSCTDTTRIKVHVTAGVDTPDIKPHDWYH